MDGGSTARLSGLREAMRTFVAMVGEPSGGRLWERSQRTASTHRVHQAAADVLRRLSRVRPTDLVTWDTHLRRSGNLGVPTTELVVAARRAIASDDTAVVHAGAALGVSLPDGHLREAALAHMNGDTPWGHALLALRATDPVPQVRLAALRAIDRIPLHDVAGLVPFVALLGARRRASVLVDDVMSRVATPAGQQDLRIGLRHGAGAIRMASWRALREAGWQPTARDIRFHLGDPDPRVRAGALNAAEALPAAERWEIASVAANDAVGTLRATAIRMLLALDLQPGPWLDAALGDHTGVVREAVQIGMRSAGREPAQIYRKRLDQRITRADILGLGECGGPSDAERLRSLIADVRAPVRDAALRALARVEPVSVAAVAERALDDVDPAVVSTAIAILRRTRVDAAVAERLERRAASDRRVTMRVSALSLLPRRAPWRRIGCVMTAMGDPSPVVRDDAARALDRWLSRSRYPGSPPTRAEWDVIRQASNVLDETRRARIVALAQRTNDGNSRVDASKI